MGNNNTTYYSPPGIPNIKNFNTLDKLPIPPIRVVSRPLNNSDSRQQWQMILSPDKNTFQLKNIQNHKFLYVGLDPDSGIAQFSTIDLDNNNYLTDLAFKKIPNNILDLNTKFNFISSFGTQLNIIDNTNEAIAISGGANLPYINSRRVRITASNKQLLSINAIFIYDSKGILINKISDNAYSYSEDNNTLATTIIDNVNKNPERSSLNAENNDPLVKELDSKFISKSDGLRDQWWEYRFDDLTGVAMVEIYGNGIVVVPAWTEAIWGWGTCSRIAYFIVVLMIPIPIFENYSCWKIVNYVFHPDVYSYENLNNIRVDLFNSNTLRSKPIWSKSSGNIGNSTSDISPDKHKVINIET